MTLVTLQANEARSTANDVLVSVLARDYAAQVVGSVFTGTRTVATLRIADVENASRRLREDPRIDTTAGS